MALRCFIAVELRDELRKGLAEAIEALRKTGADVRWVPDRNLHLTLKFLGETDESLVGAISESLRKKLSPCAPFCIKLSGVGYFPQGKHPRVVWAGIEESTPLRELQVGVEAEMVKLGYAAEERPFSPHLTLGRVKSGKRMPDLLGKLRELEGSDFGGMEVRGVTLMKSELKPAGAEYSGLAEIMFGGR